MQSALSNGSSRIPVFPPEPEAQQPGGGLPQGVGGGPIGAAGGPAMPGDGGVREGKATRTTTMTGRFGPDGQMRPDGGARPGRGSGPGGGAPGVPGGLPPGFDPSQLFGRIGAGGGGGLGGLFGGAGGGGGGGRR